MLPENKSSAPGWDEQNSQTFIDYGRYFVPERERQIETICALLPPHDQPFNVIELCCGEGLLAHAILTEHPTSTVYGLDGSPEMLRAVQQRLADFGERFQPVLFDLAALDWRKPGWPVRAGLFSGHSSLGWAAETTVISSCIPAIVPGWRLCDRGCHPAGAFGRRCRCRHRLGSRSATTGVGTGWQPRGLHPF